MSVDIDADIINSTAKLLAENQQIRPFAMVIAFALLLFALMFYSFWDRKNPYGAGIFASVLSVAIAFILSTWVLEYPVSHPELSYFFTMIAICMLFAAIAQTISFIDSYIPLTSRAKAEREAEAREQFEYDFYE